MSIQLDIPCCSVSVEQAVGDKPLLAVCEEARADVVLQQIKDELGTEYVLNMLSKSEIQEYMQLNGFLVHEDNAKAA